MDDKKVYLGVDVGAQRTGLAHADSIGRIAQPLQTVSIDGSEAETIAKVASEIGVTDMVVGRPRNQSGDKTDQTKFAEDFAKRVLEPIGLPLHWQDESVTSILAEERLAARKKPYTKADIDAEAAAIILQDFLERL